MNKASTCYTIYWDDVLVGFFSVLNMPNGGYKKAFRVHRMVVLPDYQNLGFGTKILDWFGEEFCRHGEKLFIKSTHIRLAEHCKNSNNGWLETSSSGKSVTKINGSEANKYKNIILNRPAYSFGYMGQDYITKEHIYIHVDDNLNIDYKILEQDLLYLKQNYWLCVVTGKINTPSEIENICLKLGIRTQLLYTTKNGKAKLNKAYENKKIITNWDEEFSKRVRKRY